MRARVGLNGCMESNQDRISRRIKELRELRGLNQAQLGKLVQRSKSVISRIEDGSTGLDLEMARKIARALDCSLAELLDIDAAERPSIGGGFGEDDLTPFEPLPDERFPRPTGPNRYLMTVETNALASMGIRKGDRVEVDGSAAICKNPPPMAAVRAQYHPDPQRAQHAVTLLRQFVPPAKLITNAPERDDMPLDLDRDDVQILGVITWAHKRFA